MSDILRTDKDNKFMEINVAFGSQRNTDKLYIKTKMPEGHLSKGWTFCTRSIQLLDCTHIIQGRDTVWNRNQVNNLKIKRIISINLCRQVQ